MEQKDYGDLIAELADSRTDEVCKALKAAEQEKGKLLAQQRKVLMPVIEVLQAAEKRYPQQLYVFNLDFGLAHYYSRIPQVVTKDHYAAFTDELRVEATPDNNIKVYSAMSDKIYVCGDPKKVIPTLISLIADMVRRRP